MSAHNIIPMQQASEATDGRVRLLPDFNVDGIDPDGLQVDLTRLGRAMEAGKIARLAIGSWDGETSQLYDEFDLMGATVTDEAPASSLETRLWFVDDPSGETTDDLAIYINQNEPSGVFRSTHLSARGLDRTIRSRLITRSFKPNTWQQPASLGRRITRGLHMVYCLKRPVITERRDPVQR